eukprot:11210241-Lingulodinium_polyedra.AAC.1
MVLHVSLGAHSGSRTCWHAPVCPTPGPWFCPGGPPAAGRAPAAGRPWRRGSHGAATTWPAEACTTPTT